MTVPALDAVRDQFESERCNEPLCPVCLRAAAALADLDALVQAVNEFATVPNASWGAVLRALARVTGEAR